jgi:DNA primase
MVVEWTDIDMPWIEVDNFIDIIIDKISISDILDKWGIAYEPCQSGEFTHRLKCPLPVHMNGGERTASMFISNTTNRFYCFGCNSGSSMVDLVSLYMGQPYYESLRWLSQLAGITKVDEKDLANISKRPKLDPEKTIALHVFRTGLLIKNFVNYSKGKKEYNKWCKWADDKFCKLDGYLEKLENDDWEIVKIYHDNILNFTKRKL